jgi:hypothetical protein
MSESANFTLLDQREQARIIGPKQSLTYTGEYTSDFSWPATSHLVAGQGRYVSLRENKAGNAFDATTHEGQGQTTMPLFLLFVRFSTQCCRHFHFPRCEWDPLVRETTVYVFRTDVFSREYTPQKVFSFFSPGYGGNGRRMFDGLALAQSQICRQV